MDKKAWIVISLCVIGIIFHNISTQKKYERQREFNRKKAEQEQKTAGNSGQEKPSAQEQNQVKANEAQGEFAEKPDPENALDKAPEQLVALSTDYVKFTLTNKGGGIKYAELLKHKINTHNDNFVKVNSHSKAPIGALVDDDGGLTDGTYEVISRSDSHVSFRKKLSPQISVEKNFYLVDEAKAKKNNIPTDPYNIALKIIVKNNGNTTQELKDVYLFTGAVGKINRQEDKYQIMMLYHDNGKLRRQVPSWFDGSSGWTFWKRSEPKRIYKTFSENLKFTAVTNQFFTCITHDLNEQPVKLWATRLTHEIHDNLEESGENKNYAMQSAISLPETELNSEDKEKAFYYEFYIGPKEYHRIKHLDADMAEVVDYGIFGFISKPLLWTLRKMYNWAHNYGLAIIVVTFILRIVMWPLHHKSTVGMKKMAKLNPKMQELREKYKDKPQKVNEEMMKLYRQYGVNPISSCLPMLLQIPIFIGFYYMLRSAVELRQEQFLWVEDLSLPDTVAHIPFLDIPLNPLPILMAVTMIIQMMITPKTGTGAQQKILMLMPVFFLFICYNFASALALYWTTSNIFTFIQTWITNKMPEPELVKKKVGKSLLKPPAMATMPGQKPKKKKPRIPKTGG